MTTGFLICAALYFFIMWALKRWGRKPNQPSYNWRERFRGLHIKPKVRRKCGPMP